MISSGLVNVWHLRRTERLLAHTAETLFFRALSFSGFLQAFHAGIILHKLRSGPRWKLLLYLWLIAFGFSINFKWGDTRSLSIFLAVFPTNMWPQSIFHHKVSVLTFSMAKWCEITSGCACNIITTRGYSSKWSKAVLLTANSSETRQKCCLFFQVNSAAVRTIRFWNQKDVVTVQEVN